MTDLLRATHEVFEETFGDFNESNNLLNTKELEGRSQGWFKDQVVAALMEYLNEKGLIPLFALATLSKEYGTVYIVPARVSRTHPVCVVFAHKDRQRDYMPTIFSQVDVMKEMEKLVELKKLPAEETSWRGENRFNCFGLYNQDKTWLHQYYSFGHMTSSNRFSIREKDVRVFHVLNKKLEEVCSDAARCALRKEKKDAIKERELFESNPLAPRFRKLYGAVDVNVTEVCNKWFERNEHDSLISKWQDVSPVLIPNGEGAMKCAFHRTNKEECAYQPFSPDCHWMMIDDFQLNLIDYSSNVLIQHEWSMAAKNGGVSFSSCLKKIVFCSADKDKCWSIDLEYFCLNKVFELVKFDGQKLKVGKGASRIGLNFSVSQAQLLKDMIFTLCRHVISVINPSEVPDLLEAQDLKKFNEHRAQVIVKYLDENGVFIASHIDGLKSTLRHYARRIEANGTREFVHHITRIIENLEEYEVAVTRVAQAIGNTRDYGELGKLDRCIKKQVLVYDSFVAHVLNMIVAGAEGNLTSYYEIYEVFDRNGMLLSFGEKSVLLQLRRIGHKIDEMSKNIELLNETLRSFEENVLIELAQLRHMSSESTRSLERQLTKELSGLKTQVFIGNILAAAASYRKPV